MGSLVTGNALVLTFRGLVNGSAPFPVEFSQSRLFHWTSENSITVLRQCRSMRRDTVQYPHNILCTEWTCTVHYDYKFDHSAE